MIYKGLLFLLGVSSSLWLPDINSAIYGGLFCLLFILVFYFSVWFKPALNKIKIFQIIRQYLSFLLFGIIWTSINIVIYSQLANPLTSNKANVEVEGIICSIPSYQYHRVQFDFCIDKLDGQSLSLLAYDKFKFSYDPSQNELVFAKNQDPNLLAGQSWHFIAKLEPPHGRYNEAGFDYQKWMLAEGYAGKGKIKQGSLSINSQPIFTSIFAYYHALRQDIYTYLYNLFPADQYRALLMALTLGERTDISQTQWEIFRQTGTSHLLAISGLHVGVAALWSYWLILWLWSSSERLCLIIPAQKTAQIASLFGAATILLLSGLGLPAQRAFLMLTIFIISRWLGVYYRLSSVIAIVIICVLLWQPFAVLSASFWLSFLAVLVIALVIGRQEYQSQKLHGWLNVNWYLYLAMLFISVLFFNQFSIVSFIANLILIPITSFLLIPVLYGGLLLTLFNQTIAVWLFDISSKIMSLIDWIQINLSELNQFIINTSVNTMSQMSILIGLLFLFVLMLPNKFYSKVIFLPILLMFSLSFLVKPEKKIFEMVVFDIGQGLAIYIETPEGNLIYDTGWGNDEFSMASSTILPWLNNRQIKKIDKLIISHADSDHAGGLIEIANNFSIAELILGEALREPSLKLNQIKQNQINNRQNCHYYPDWDWQGVKFSFLDTSITQSAMNKQPLTGNNASCVLSVKTPKGNILLTGDIEKSIEARLIDKGLVHYDILIAPHHGSKTSSTVDFIEQVSPNTVIFSTGFNNQWNFPKEQVVARYVQQNSQIYITHLNGSISIELLDKLDELKVTSYKQKNPHFWYE